MFRPRGGRPLPKHKVFPFMKLPSEIRNTIYRECLVSHEVKDEPRTALYFLACRRGYRRAVNRSTADVVVNPSHRRPHFAHHHPRGRSNSEPRNETDPTPVVKPVVVNLLATCKAVYAEAAPLLYHQRFVFHDSMALMNFVSECTPRTAALLRHVEVVRWEHTRTQKQVAFLAMSMLATKGCVNLESLKIAWSLRYIWRASRPIHELVARKVYRDLYPWLDAVGKASGNMYKGLTALNIGDEIWKRSSNLQHLQAREADLAAAAYHKELKKLIRENWV